jgi:hypothetical protein
MNKTTAILAAALALTLAALAFLGGYATHKLLHPQAPPQAHVRDTVWVEHRDTVILASSKPVGSIIAKLPTVAPPAPEVPENGPQMTIRDSIIVRDSVAVEVPIEERTYQGEYYRAVVRGWRPELVSIDVRHPEVSVEAPRHKWWTVTVGPQVGYGFTPAGWQPYAGVGVTVGLTF